jgi:hypothetical protein
LTTAGFTAGIFTAVSLLYVYLARFGIDPHHDGIMFGAAIAASEGMAPFRDFFAMYGWPISLVQGISLRVTEPSIFALRSTSALTLAMAIAIFWRTWFRDYGAAKSLFSSGIVVLVTPFVSLSYGLLPWNSDLILLSQACLLAILSGRCDEEPRSREALRLTGAAILLSVILWSRLTIGITTTVLVSLVFLLARKYVQLRTLWSAVLLTNTLVILYLWKSGLIGDFAFQYLDFPRKFFVGELGPAAIRGIVVSIILYSPLAVLVGVWAGVLCRGVWRQTWMRRSLVSTLILSFMVMVYLNRRDVPSWLARVSQESVLWTLFLLTLAKALIVCIELAKSSNRKEAISDHRVLLQLAVVIGGLVQVFPVSDWYHLWWAITPATGPIVGWLGKRPRSNTRTGTYASTIFLGLLSFIFVSLITVKASKEYVDASTIRILNKSLMHPEDFERIAPAMLLIQEVQDELGPKEILNVCRDGLYFGLSRKQRSNSPFFVTWQMGIGVNRRSSETKSLTSSERPLVVFCVENGYSWDNDAEDLFQPFADSGYSLVTVEFCGVPIQVPRLFLGLPNELRAWWNDAPPNNPEVCIRGVLSPT